LIRSEILLFLLNGPATSKEIVKNCPGSKNTVYKYRDELEDDKKIIYIHHRKQGKSKFKLSKIGKKDAENLKQKQEINKRIEKWTPQKFQEFLKFFDFLVDSKEGEEFWLWLPDVQNPKIAKIFQHIRTKNLIQDIPR